MCDFLMGLMWGVREREETRIFPRLWLEPWEYCCCYYLRYGKLWVVQVWGEGRLGIPFGHFEM